MSHAVAYKMPKAMEKYLNHHPESGRGRLRAIFRNFFGLETF